MRFELRIRIEVPGGIPGDLLMPEIRIGLEGAGSVPWAAVPEATVDEDRDLVTGEDDVRSTSDCWFWPSVHAIPETPGMKDSTYGEFGSRISWSVRLHDPASRWRGRPGLFPLHDYGCGMSSRMSIACSTSSWLLTIILLFAGVPDEFQATTSP